MLKLAVVLVLASVLGLGDISDDAYALYSEILRSGNVCSPLRPGEVAAIRVESGKALPVDVDAMRPRSAEERAMVEGLRRLNTVRSAWSAKFDFGRHYRMLDEREAEVAGRCMYRGEFEKPECSPYQGMIWVRSFSVPSFNAAHTRALVAIWNKREGWGGGSELAEYRKVGGKWRRQVETFVPGHCFKY